MPYYIYLLECSDGSLYTGFTTDVGRRLKTHNAGKGAKYTRSRLPVRLVYSEEYATEHEARSRECAVKKLTRAEKFALIGGKGE